MAKRGIFFLLQWSCGSLHGGAGGNALFAPRGLSLKLEPFRLQAGLLYIKCIVFVSLRADLEKCLRCMLYKPSWPIFIGPASFELRWASCSSWLVACLPPVTG